VAQEFVGVCKYWRDIRLSDAEVNRIINYLGLIIECLGLLPVGRSKNEVYFNGAVNFEPRINHYDAGCRSELAVDH